MKISLLNLLQSVDTPTVCNAIEVAQGKRGFNDFTRGTMHASDIKGVIVGYAVTAQIAAIEPPTESVSVIRERRMGYYRAMSESVKPSIAVVEDLDYPNCIGAFWGEVNTAIHKGLGCLGVVTNGSFRDIDACAHGFQLLGGKVAPSHAWVHLVDIECEVNIFGMAVKPNDIIHADRHGAVVVPDHCVKQLPDAIDLLTRREAVILDVARSPDFNVEILKKAMADSAEIH